MSKQPAPAGAINSSRMRPAGRVDLRGIGAVLVAFASDSSPATTLYDLDHPALAGLDLSKDARTWLQAKMLAGIAPNTLPTTVPWKHLAAAIAIATGLVAVPILTRASWLLLVTIPLATLVVLAAALMLLPAAVGRAKKGSVYLAVTAAVVPGGEQPELELTQLWALADLAYDAWRRDGSLLSDADLVTIRAQIAEGLRCVVAARRLHSRSAAAEQLFEAGQHQAAAWGALCAAERRI